MKEDTVIWTLNVPRRLLNPKTTDCCRQNKVRFITVNNSRHRKVASILEKYWHILRSDMVPRAVLPDRSSITYRRSKNWRYILVQSYYKAPSPGNIFGSKSQKQELYFLPHYCKDWVVFFHNTWILSTCMEARLGYMHSKRSNGCGQFENYPQTFQECVQLWKNITNLLLLMVHGMDLVFIGPRGGNWKK